MTMEGERVLVKPQDTQSADKPPAELNLLGLLNEDDKRTTLPTMPEHVILSGTHSAAADEMLREFQLFDGGKGDQNGHGEKHFPPRPPGPEPSAAAEEYAEAQDLTVEAVERNGQIVYEFSVTNADGSKEVVITSNEESYQADIERYHAKTVERLEEEYNVVIHVEGESADVGGSTSGESELRSPTIQELHSLEYGLERSDPSYQREDGEPLDLYFPVDTTLPGSAAYVTTIDGEPIVVFQPWFETASADAQTRTIIHEFAHVGDRTIHERDNDDSFLENLRDHINGYEGDLSQEEYAAQLGYHYENGRWIVETEDGRFFHQPSFTDTEFYQTNENGEYINEAGEVVEDKEDAVSISESDLAQIALVQPSSNYFPTPFELHAEATELYRSGAESRRELYMMNPELYETIKAADQREIDAQYPPVDGEPSMIRLPDGSLGENTAQNQKIVMAFEATLTADFAGGAGHKEAGESLTRTLQKDFGIMMCGCADCHT